MSQPGSQPPAVAPNNPTLTFDPSTLPIPQLESLKFKANQIIESIQLLQRPLEVGGQNVMPAWPDILSKYNILLSQTHNFSTSLVGGLGLGGGTGKAQENPYEKLALHPSAGMTDTQLDNEIIPLLRNQQTTDVLRMENETVRKLSEHMETKGSVGVLFPPASIAPTTSRGMPQIQPRKPEYHEVLRECEDIKNAHDHRVERAVRAVHMLRDKFEWKARVEVDQEEPEDLEWDPTAANGGRNGGVSEDVTEGEGEGDVNMNGDGGNDDDEEMEMEDVLGEVNGRGTPSTAGFGTPAPEPS
ncbi:hypothetical protein JAAARDRAFT_40713 [Jaapia argillacea MUCL 33604]|uniref:Mediator of RNA polymerase II transcription subunit 8 n=1 Tax=Jaapia argillacea MUCL 33604 TaxID=933084 RepID=A0A067PNJ4_9AGAM|nr:hypothetical protein JAAARDRAFT_40713 [Jaapia argillacea MUCL 33604]